jgi:hypothetical protein
MQKVESSSLFSRLIEKPCQSRGFSVSGERSWQPTSVLYNTPVQHLWVGRVGFVVGHLRAPQKVKARALRSARPSAPASVWSQYPRASSASSRRLDPQRPDPCARYSVVGPVFGRSYFLLDPGTSLDAELPDNLDNFGQLHRVCGVYSWTEVVRSGLRSARTSSVGCTNRQPPR